MSFDCRCLSTTSCCCHDVTFRPISLPFTTLCIVTSVGPTEHWTSWRQWATQYHIAPHNVSGTHDTTLRLMTSVTPQHYTAPHDVSGSHNTALCLMTSVGCRIPHFASWRQWAPQHHTEPHNVSGSHNMPASELRGSNRWSVTLVWGAPTDGRTVRRTTANEGAERVASTPRTTEAHQIFRSEK